MADHDPGNNDDRGLTRRGFLGTVSAGAAAAAALRAGQAEERPPTPHPDAMEPVALRINGHLQRVLVEPRWSLLYVLREHLGLTGTKAGCERGECGACTVLIDDRPHYACLVLALEAEGREITTLEGLMRGESLGTVQQAFVDEDAFQCGYCTPGQIMAAEGLLRAVPAPDLDTVRHGMSGNLCRCAAYEHIFKAVDRAARTRGGEGGA
jgi:xanthine dehydrogenase YagT iron-sulfur-binding subunit